MTAAAGFPALAAAAPRLAEHTVMVGGAPMYPSKNIVENAVHSKDHTTLGRSDARHVRGSGRVCSPD